MPGLFTILRTRGLYFWDRMRSLLFSVHPSLERTYQAPRVRLMMAFAFFLAWTAAIAWISSVRMNGAYYSNLGLGLWALTCTLAYLSGHTRFYRGSAHLLITGTVVFGYLTSLGGGSHATTLIPALSLAAILGSVFLSLRAQFVQALVSVPWVLFMPGEDFQNNLIEMCSILALTSLLIIVTSFRNDWERQRVTELRLANLELEQIRTHLDEEVAERTRSLEHARQEAEHAHRNAEATRLRMETQAWLNAGRVQLLDQIRGEQDLAHLSEKIITTLCRYINAQVGVLFIAENDMLILRGSYAYSGDPDARFEVGQGVIGQAALEQRPILLADIPAGMLHVRTAFNTLDPYQIILLPVVYNDRLVALLELATLAKLEDDPLELLFSTIESVGIAINSAQERERVSQLLKQSQILAEDLKRREDELRATNEELELQAEELRAVNEELEAQADNLRELRSRQESGGKHEKGGIL